MTEYRTSLPIVGGVLAAVGAGVCCAGPLILVLLGISGSWIANLRLFEPFKPYFVLLVVALFSYAGWQVFRSPAHCAPGAACAVPKTRQRRQLVFCVALVVAIIAVTSNYWILFLV